jgi:histidinol-phosphate/aromatic aminotransferase/cobyric acid decarboxylase-like protein
MHQEIVLLIQKLTNHKFIEIVLCGNSAINSALSLVPKDKVVLIPEEGGWIHYQKAPNKLCLGVIEVKCNDAKIDLKDLENKLNKNPCGAFLYQNPGGYFAEQPMKEIYELCQKKKCLVILDVSGAIGTKLCDGKSADLMIGSFGEWKLVEAKIGGFISSKDKDIFNRLKLEKLDEPRQLKIIFEKLNELPKRINFLQEKRNKIVSELKKQKFEVVHSSDLGFVVVIKFSGEKIKRDLVEFCQVRDLPYTLCPRYIRLNSPAVSIEIKQIISD